jgi:hypothetical protein
MRGLLFSLLLLAANSAYAQVPGLKDFQLPLPDSNAKKWLSLKVNPGAKQELMSPAEADTLAGELTSQFQAFNKYKTMPKPSCNGAEALNYTLALHIRGDFRGCMDFARSCVSSATDPRVILRGALCAYSSYDFKSADQLYEAAAQPRFAQKPEYKEVLFQYASYAMLGNHEDLVESILARHPTWSLEERKSWEGVIRRMADIQLTDLTIDEVDRFLDARIASESGTFLALLKSIKLNNSLGDFRYEDAVRELSVYAPTLQNPLLWYSTAYNVLYYGLDSDFSFARKIYDAYDPFAHRWSWFPNENNTYNYSQIYSQACPTKLTQGQAATEFAGVKRNIQNGTLGPQQALDALNALNVRYPNKADILTAIGGMYSMLERHEEAIATYWEAHSLCRYYNRANWGLLLEKRFAKYSKMDDYLKNLERLNRELAGLTLPAEMSRYISNWNSLAPEPRKRVYYGARIWLPYIRMLAENGRNAYIKYAFELLSEGPGMSRMRDLRIANSNDNRLWDDVRGLGGNTVIADLSEVMQTVQGDYNLLGHEMAHQFEFLMGEFHQPGYDCIVKMYEKASNENNFPDAYAATNKEEHFAQLITYYLVPSDAPKRFGLNRTWLETFDTTALTFIQSIEASKGTISKISCPL